MSKTAVVTGGCGFIGRHLCSALADEGWRVVVVDRCLPDQVSSSPAFEADVEVVTGDIGEKETWGSLGKVRADVLYHLASGADVRASVENPWEDLRTNVIGTFHALELARHGDVGKVVFPSSVSVCRPTMGRPISEDAPTQASSPYGAGLAAGENYCFAYATSYGIDVSVLRLFNVYGPLMRKFVIHDLIRKLQQSSSALEILGDGRQVRDYLYVDDAVEAFKLVASQGERGGLYHVGSGVPVTIRELALELIELMGLEDVDLRFTMRSWPGDVAGWFADTRKIAALGFRPRVALRDGLERTIEYLEACR